MMGRTNPASTWRRISVWRHTRAGIALPVFSLVTGAAVLGAPPLARAARPTPASQAFFDSTAGEKATGGEEIAHGREICFPTVQL